MELSQFKIRSFIIGIIALGLLITLVSFGISQIYNTFIKSPKDKVAVVSKTPSPNSSPPSSTNPGKSPTPNPKQTPAPTATPTPTTVPVTNQPTTGSDELEIRNPGISIDNVQAGDTVNSGITIAGHANVTNTKVIIEIKDSNGKVLGSGNTNGCVGYDACPFQTTIVFEKPAHYSTGTLFAYNPTASNDKLYTVSLPINF